MTKHKYKLFKKYMVFLGYEKYIRKIPRRLLQEHLKSLPDSFWTDDDYPTCVVLRGILFDCVPQLYQLMK